MLQPKSVDVSISVYGKPYLTAVTLLSLLKHSGQWIDTIYFTEEREQPENTDFTQLKEWLKPYRVVYNRPPVHYGYRNMVESPRRFMLAVPHFRRAIRYQYAWEKAKNPYLFITHNDVLYKADLIKAYAEAIGDGVGIGKVGQCWNCPAFKESVCDGDRYLTFRPTEAELVQLYEKHGDARGGSYKKQLDQKGPWPLPECRLNEYTCMIDLRKARAATVPAGKAQMYGLFGNIDINTDWFSDISHQGLTVTNFDYDPYAAHSWVNALNNGHRALSDKSIYDSEEAIARQYLETEFGIITN